MSSEKKDGAASYTVRLLAGPIRDPHNENIDVNVDFEDGRRYVPTFYTLENLRWLFEKNKATGECRNGLYLWGSDMIIVESLTMDIIRQTVAELVESGELQKACREFRREPWPE